jgi:predicted aminopeptidase
MLPFLRLFCVCCLLLGLNSCRTLNFYTQAVSGQVSMMVRREPLAKVAARSETPAKLRDRLLLTEKVLAFAKQEMGLSSNGSYETYADIGREHLVWIVHAAPELSMTPKSWWYPVVGRQDYRGFFHEADAKEEARLLQLQGYETHIGEVDAYSTLGTFRDPVLNTFVLRDEADYVELLFHELTHHRLYVKKNTPFNEGLAEAVCREGVVRWFHHTGRPEEAERYRQRLKRYHQASAAITRCASELKTIYARPISDAEKRREKARAIAQLRDDLKILRQTWGGGLSSWIKGEINNARLISFTTYENEVPRFQEILRESHGDFGAFWKRIEQMKK